MLVSLFRFLFDGRYFASHVGMVVGALILVFVIVAIMKADKV